MKTPKDKTETRRPARKAIGRSPNGLSPGRKIVAAIKEATEILREDGLQSRRLTIRAYKDQPRPPRCRPADVKRVRNLLGASQAVFAQFLGVNVNTVRSWEQGKRLPQSIACRFLSEIESNPMYWRQRIADITVEMETGNRHER